MKRQELFTSRVLVPILCGTMAAVASNHVACTHAPPNLSPTAQAAYNKTRVIKVLDLVRDTAVDGNATIPPIISTPLARKVVTAHRSALKVMDATASGWQAIVQASLDELLNNVSPSERQILTPYVALAKTVIAEVTP